MDEDWVDLRHCQWLHEAHFIKSLLAAEGVEALIPDEYAIAVQPPLANMIGGVRVLVRKIDEARAHDILASVHNG